MSGDSSGAELRTIAKSGLVTVAGSVTGTIATLGLVVLVSRAAGATDAGLFFQAVGLLTTGSVVCAWGGASGLVRAVSREFAQSRTPLEGLYQAAFWPVLTSSILAAALGMTFCLPLAGLLTSSQNRASLMLILLCIMPSLPLMAVIRLAVAAARGSGRTQPTVLYDTGGQPLLRLALSIIPAALQSPVWGYALAWTGAAVLCCPGALRSLPAVPVCRVVRRRPPRPDLKSFWRFAGPRGMEETFQVTNTWMLIVLVGALASAKDAAVYAAVSRSAAASGLILQGVIFATAPRISAAFAQHDFERVRIIFQTVTNYLVLISFPLVVLMATFPAGVLRIISPEFAGGAGALQLLSLATLLNLATGPVGSVLLMAGKSSWNLFDAFLGVAAMMAVASALIPSYGAAGAAAALASAICVQNIAALVQIYRGFRILPITLKTVVIAATSGGVALVASGSVQSWLGDNIRSLALTAGAIGLVGFPAITFIVRRHNSLLTATPRGRHVARV